jgi:RNA polymerase sigma-54 factor
VALETKLLLKTSQKLVITATLQQAIKLLPLSRLELIHKVQQEILENPLLDEVPTQESSDLALLDAEPEPTTPQESTEAEVDWEAYVQDYHSRSEQTPDMGKDMPSLEATLRSETSLAEHLLWQLSVAVDDPLDKQIGAYLIGNIDEDGYLQCELAEIATELTCDEARVEAVLLDIQAFDPPGIGARNLQESLCIQLHHLETDTSLALRIVEQYLHQLDERSFQKIARACGATVQDVIAAVELIRTLDPKPGSRFNAQRIEYIVPDVYVVKVDDDYQIVLNEDGMPRLRINTLYQNVLQQHDGMQGETREYLEDKFRAAVWLMKSVEQRRQTLLRVTKSICKFQREFLDKGLAALKPLILKDVADDIGMHESTVSRVTTNKYVHTPQGVFELKFFFHSGLASLEGDAMSSVSVKDTLRKAVGAEDPHKPLTDQQLMEIFEAKGVQIARRTIAKYRKELRIPPASRRKRLFSH